MSRRTGPEPGGDAAVPGSASGGRRPLRAALGLLALVPLTSACDSPYSIFVPATGETARLSQMGWFLVALMSVATLVMGFLIVLGALRRAGNLDEHAPIDEGGGKGWILVGGVAIPVAVFAGLFLVTVIALGGASEAENPDEVDLTINVSARQWWWRVVYEDSLPSRRFTTANEIHVPVGRTVRVNLRSTDVIHSFWVPALHGKLDAIPGQTNSLIFEADEPGVYAGECAEYCGVQHSHMRFEVVAEPPEEYRSWAEAQRAPAPSPETAAERRGQEAFLGNACALCHTIRGTPARGRVGPDLTHLARRRMIAAGTLRNTRANLHAWVVDAQSLKPGAKMPSVNAFDGETLGDLVTYLQSLR